VEVISPHDLAEEILQKVVEYFQSPFTLVGPLQLAIPIMKDHESAGKEVLSTVPPVAAAA